MLDPSIPWLATGYKNFESDDITKTQSYDDITKLYHVNQEEFIKKELRSSTPELRQRRRVKSATIQRQLTRQSASDRPPRPKTAIGIAGLRNYGWRSENLPIRRRSTDSLSPGHSPTRLGSAQSQYEGSRTRSRPGSSQSYNREKVGCYEYTSDHPLPQSFMEHATKPSPKSAILIKHRPSSLDRKSVSQVERQFYKERMTNGVSPEEDDSRCAFCPVECRTGSSSSNRPTSSTGLVAVPLASHYDRYTLWTRPRTAPSTKKEFQQKPRHNYVNRGRVPHYTNFVKRINLGLRDQTPSPPPRVIRAFEEPVKPAPPPFREPRESKPRSHPPPAPKPDPPKQPTPPVPIEPEEVEEIIEEPDKLVVEETVRIPSPIDDLPVEVEEELIPPTAASSAWTEPRAPTPTPTASPPPEPTEEEQRIPTPPPREPTPPPPEEPKPPPEPEPEPPKEPTPPPTPPREPTPPPLPPPQPPKEPAPPPLPTAPPPKLKKEVRIHDPPVTEPPPKKEIKKRERRAPNLVKRPSVIKKPEVNLEPEPKPAEEKSEPVVIEPIQVQEKEPKVPKQVEIPSLPQVKTTEDPTPEPPEEISPPEEDPKPEETNDETDAGDKKKQLGPPPPKVKVDIFGRSMDPEQLLDLEMKSRRRGQGDEDDEFEYSSNYHDADLIPDSAMKKSKIESWLKGRMALSKRASRFELPMDVRELEGMTPIAYLERYCIVNKRRSALYKRAFNRVDKDCDMIINQKEMEMAIEDALVDTVHLDQINYVLNLIEAEEGLKIRPKLFSAICALLERLFYHEFVTEDTVEMEGYTKERVETADFSALDWKLEGCTVNPPLKKLLYRLL